MTITAPIGIQRRFMELGRVRLGEKGTKGEPKKLDHFRFTSASRQLLEAVSEKYGGKVQEWRGAPDEGYFELKTASAELSIILPPTFSTQDGSPTLAWSQFYELWSGGGCQRRCDGVTEALSGKPCMCNPEERTCDITTRIQFMLPDIPGIGVWRLDTKGWNAAAELPGTLQLLQLAAEERKFIPAVLRMEKRTSKVEGQTRRYVVPVIDLPGLSVEQLVGGDLLTLNAPAPAPPKPALPEGPPPPEDPGFADIPFGEAPPLPEPERQTASPAAQGKTDVPVVASVETPPMEALSPDEPEGAAGGAAPEAPVEVEYSPIAEAGSMVFHGNSKHAGQTVADVAESDPDYLDYALNVSPNEKLKAAIVTWRAHLEVK